VLGLAGSALSGVQAGMSLKAPDSGNLAKVDYSKTFK
jgi:hypothetical protein